MIDLNTPLLQQLSHLRIRYIPAQAKPKGVKACRGACTAIKMIAFGKYRPENFIVSRTDTSICSVSESAGVRGLQQIPK